MWVRALRGWKEVDTGFPLPRADTLDAGRSWSTDGPRFLEDPLDLPKLLEAWEIVDSWKLV